MFFLKKKSTNDVVIDMKVYVDHLPAPTNYKAVLGTI